jgi:hypothetical protein
MYSIFNYVFELYSRKFYAQIIQRTKVLDEGREGGDDDLLSKFGELGLSLITTIEIILSKLSRSR